MNIQIKLSIFKNFLEGVAANAAGLIYDDVAKKQSEIFGLSYQALYIVISLVFLFSALSL